jgi:hypothetical protein
MMAGETRFWTLPLRRAAAGYAAVGTTCTMTVALVFLDVPALQRAFERTGFDPDRAHAAAEASRITGTLFNIALCALYVAVGLAAIRKRSRWAFWTGLVLYAFTGAGVVIVPMRETGLPPAGLLLTLLNDGIALVLFLWMLATILRHRERSEQRKETRQADRHIR